MVGEDNKNQGNLEQISGGQEGGDEFGKLGSALEATSGHLFYHNGKIVTKEQKDAEKKIALDKPLEEQAQEAYSNYLRQFGFLKGLYKDCACKGTFFREFYKSKGIDKDAKKAEDEPKTVAGRAFNWFGAKYNRVLAVNLMALGVVAGLYFVAGAPIWENAKAKNKLDFEQTVEQYLKMDVHRIKAKTQSEMYEECIDKNTKLGFEAYRAAQWLDNHYDTIPEDWKKLIASEKWKTDVVSEGLADGPCNKKDPIHASERKPAPKMHYNK